MESWTHFESHYPDAYRFVCRMLGNRDAPEPQPALVRDMQDVVEKEAASGLCVWLTFSVTLVRKALIARMRVSTVTSG